MRRRASGPRFGANNIPRANPTAPPANALYTPVRVARCRDFFFMNNRRAGREECGKRTSLLYRMNRIQFLPLAGVRPNTGEKPSCLRALNITDLVRFLQQVFGNLHGLCVGTPAAPAVPPNRPCSPHFASSHDEFLLLARTVLPLHGAEGHSRMSDVRGPPRKHS